MIYNFSFHYSNLRQFFVSLDEKGGAGSEQEMSVIVAILDDLRTRVTAIQEKVNGHPCCSEEDSQQSSEDIESVVTEVTESSEILSMFPDEVSDEVSDDSYESSEDQEETDYSEEITCPSPITDNPAEHDEFTPLSENTYIPTAEELSPTSEHDEFTALSENTYIPTAEELSPTSEYGMKKYQGDLGNIEEQIGAEGDIKHLRYAFVKVGSKDIEHKDVDHILQVRVFFFDTTNPTIKKATEETNYLSDKLRIAVFIKILTNVLYFKMEIYGIV